jgi:hypothetical protein
MNAPRRLLCLACLCLVFIGCGGRNYAGDQRYPLTGKVTYDGQDVDAGTISFLPMGGDKQRVSGGVIEEGAYSVPEADGANAGKYRVEIRWAKKTGKQHYDGELQMKVDDRQEGLPPKFHKQSDLTADVSSEQTNFDFHLKSK